MRCAATADFKRLRSIHYGMVARCHDPESDQFWKYGARGITVCTEWRDSLTTFVDWAIANGYAPGLQIDREKPWLGYSPDNCRWVTVFEQQMNKRLLKTTSTRVGVRRHSTGLFEARIWANGKRLTLGYFKNENDAGEAYRAAVLKYHGKNLDEVLCRYSHSPKTDVSR